jgi:hypothetical protein
VPPRAGRPQRVQVGLDPAREAELARESVKRH